MKNTCLLLLLSEKRKLFGRLSAFFIFVFVVFRLQLKKNIIPLNVVKKVYNLPVDVIGMRQFFIDKQVQYILLYEYEFLSSSLSILSSMTIHQDTTKINKIESRKLWTAKYGA